MFSKDFLYEEAIYEWKKVKEIKQEINKDYPVYTTDDKKKDKTYDFLDLLRSLGRDIQSHVLTLNDALEEQIKQMMKKMIKYIFIKSLR